MTARKFSQYCGISSHYTCSETNCNHKQQNTTPVNGTACLRQSITFTKSNSRRTNIGRVVFSFVIVVLLICATAFLTGCGRKSGEFPNIPEVMDECGSWTEEEFASKMNLELNTKLTGGSEVVPPNWAKDLTSVVGNDDLVTMYLLNNTVTIALTADLFEVSYDTPYQAQDAMRSFTRYYFGYSDAIELLDLVGIKKNSIKVYDDTSSEELTPLGSGQYYVTWMYGKQYKMCGETVTADDSPLYFGISAQAGFMYSNSTNGTEISPYDSVVMRFTKVKPFDLSETL